jgi:hypothetical protein
MSFSRSFLSSLFVPPITHLARLPGIRGVRGWGWLLRWAWRWLERVATRGMVGFDMVCLEVWSKTCGGLYSDTELVAKCGVLPA